MSHLLGVSLVKTKMGVRNIFVDGDSSCRDVICRRQHIWASIRRLFSGSLVAGYARAVSAAVCRVEHFYGVLSTCRRRQRLQYTGGPVCDVVSFMRRPVIQRDNRRRDFGSHRKRPIANGSRKQQAIKGHNIGQLGRLGKYNTTAKIT